MKELLIYPISFFLFVFDLVARVFIIIAVLTWYIENTTPSTSFRLIIVISLVVFLVKPIFYKIFKQAKEAD